MIVRDIQGVEVMFFVFYLGPGTNAEPGGAKYAFDTLLCACDRVQSANALPPTGQRDIDGAGRDLFFIFFTVEDIAARL